MKKEIFQRTAFSTLCSAIRPVLFSLAIMALIVYGLRQTERSSEAEGLRVLEEGLLRAAVTCYSLEGRYPPTLLYIEERYGVRVDRTKYAVYYEVFASNILPDITVALK